jgi:hypothetical protein
MNVLSFRRLRRLSTTAIDIAHGMLDTIDYALDALNNEGNIMFTPTQEPSPSIKHSYHMCKKCGKKGAYIYTPKKGDVRVTVSVEYCRYCRPRISAARPTSTYPTEEKKGVFSFLRRFIGG